MEVSAITGETMPGDDGLVSYVVTYAEGNEEIRRGSLLEVGRLASLAGLHLAHSDVGTFRYS